MTSLSDKEWKEFFDKFPELCGPDTPSKPLLVALLRDKYSAFFRFLPNGVESFIDGINALPISFERIRRDSQRFKEKNSYYKVPKMQGKMF